MMPTVIMLQDWKSRKDGEKWSPAESTAKLLVASGKAVLVDDSQPVAELPEPIVAVPDPETIVVLTEPPVVETGPPVVLTEPPVIETDHAAVESTGLEPGFQELPAEALPPQPSRYAPHRSWIKPSDS